MLERVKEKFSSLDILVRNTGIIPYGKLEKLSDDDWIRTFNLILFNAVKIVRACLSLMKKNRNGGSIVYIISATVQYPPGPHLILFNLFRSGVTELMKTICINEAKNNIRVNCVAPGLVATGRILERAQKMVDEQGISVYKALRNLDEQLGIPFDRKELEILRTFPGIEIVNTKAINMCCGGMASSSNISESIFLSSNIIEESESANVDFLATNCVFF